MFLIAVLVMAKKRRQCCTHYDCDADLRLLDVALWRLWFRRNRLIHENIALPTVDIMNWSISFLADFDTANLSFFPSTGSGLAVGWKAPMEGWYKLNVDASLNNDACLLA
ncbi:hypothetical protein ACOSP7_010193 [Xanthoceras sorbifolium]